MNINLPNGNTITISTYEYLFLLDDKDMDDFYQSCMADDLGHYIENPFSDSGMQFTIIKEDEDSDII